MITIKIILFVVLIFINISSSAYCSRHWAQSQGRDSAKVSDCAECGTQIENCQGSGFDSSSTCILSNNQCIDDPTRSSYKRKHTLRGEKRPVSNRFDSLIADSGKNHVNTKVDDTQSSRRKLSATYTDIGSGTSTIGCDGDFTQISSGDFMACAIEAGYIKCWGYETHPDDGVIANAPTGGDFVHVSCGHDLTRNCCAVKIDGQIMCWGSDNHNQITNTPTSSDFVKVEVMQVWHLCGLKSSGSIECWGNMNVHGVIPTHNDIVRLSCGRWNCGIVRSNGQILMWGYDGQEQGGLVSNTPSTSDFDDISVGTNHACALRNSGEIICWGLDHHGRISSAPSDTDFIAVSAGVEESCGVQSDNTIQCWGRHRVYVPDGDDFIFVTSGIGQSCGLHSSGRVSCWDGGAVSEIPEVTCAPSKSPSFSPTPSPTSQPTVDPTRAPSESPSFDPTPSPTSQPTVDPTRGPSKSPSFGPTPSPTSQPTVDPTRAPSKSPSFNPTPSPTSQPTVDPTRAPSKSPSFDPTPSPTSQPTVDPTKAPSKSPSFRPTPSPTSQPTVDPTKAPSKSPSSSPSTSPTAGDFIIKIRGFAGDPQDFIDWEMANREQPRMSAYQFDFVRQLKRALPKSTCSATITRAFELSSDLTGTGVTLIAFVNFDAAYNDHIEILKQQSDVCGLSAGQNGWMHMLQFKGEMLYCICGRGCVSTILPKSGSGNVAVTYDVNSLPKFYIDGVLQLNDGTRNDFSLSTPITTTRYWESACTDKAVVLDTVLPVSQLTRASRT